jgi:hypothetical protein
MLVRIRGLPAVIGGIGVAVLVLALPSTAAAITTDQVIELAKGGVSESVILAVITRDNNPFDLDTAQIVALKQQGVSDAIVMAMLKSGRGETAEAPITVIAPDVVIIGHGPDIPNTSYWDRLYWNPTYVIPYIPQYTFPYAPTPYTAPRVPIRPRRIAR